MNGELGALDARGKDLYQRWGRGHVGATRKNQRRNPYLLEQREAQLSPHASTRGGVSKSPATTAGFPFRSRPTDVCRLDWPLGISARFANFRGQRIELRRNECGLRD